MEDEALETPEVSEPETPEPEVNEPEVHEPPPDHPRFNEIYGKMKQYERDLAARDETIQNIGQQYRKLSEALDSVQEKTFADEMPDPIEDPKGYRDWIKQDVKRELERSVAPGITPQPQIPENVRRLQIMEQAAAEFVPDYYEVVEEVKKDFASNPKLYSDIMMAPNPAKAAYEYGKSKKAQANQNRQNNLDKGYVEGETRQPATVKAKLTDRQKATADALGVKHEDFLKHLQVTEQRGY